MEKQLTEFQRTVYDLKEKDGKSYAEIALMLGRSATTIRECYQAAWGKLNGAPTSDASPAFETRAEPEKVAEAIDKITDPFVRLVEVAKECGLKPAVVEGLARRMRTRYQGVGAAMTAVKTKELVHKIDERINHALGYMDDYIMGEASFRDLSMGVAQLIEKRQLLKGEPTQIVSVEERKTLNELVPALVREARRRGLTIEGEVVSATVTPQASLPVEVSNAPAG